jgi:nitrite reductase/ring-hydroxylating ferredoxin subunit
MSSTYSAIDWNPQKRRYDLAVGGLVLLAVVPFAAVTAFVSPNVTAETVVIRASAVTALLLLHLVLAIGPLARLDRRFLPLLYNRRHLGVTLFVFGLLHAAFAVVQFHALGDVNPLVSVFTAYASGGSGPAHLPFEPFGAAALVILFLMAATSHDFWLRLLGPSLWKTLHLGVYAAYALLVVHVAAGALQSERSAVLPAVLGAGFAVLAGLHLVAARRGSVVEAAGQAAATDGFLDVADVGTVREGRGRVVTAGTVRIALFRHEGRIFATSNVCRHQGGPLGEGRILDGCITCPWHGWNYRPEDGCSPPPFQEVVETFPTRIAGNRVWVNPTANPLRTACHGSIVPEALRHG